MKDGKKMLKYRRIIGLVAAIMVLFGLVCTALASSATDDGSWTYFTLDRGAASTSSPSARTKYVNPGILYIFAQPKNTYSTTDWPTGQTVNFRGRTINRDNATYLLSIDHAQERNIEYFSNSGVMGNRYYLYSNYPSGSAYSRVNVKAYWQP